MQHDLAKWSEPSVKKNIQCKYKIRIYKNFDGVK